MVICSKIANTIDTPRTDLKYAQETENLVIDVEWNEEFPSTTTQQEDPNPQIMHSPVISREEENIEVTVDSTADIQDSGIDNESLGEKNSTKFCSAGKVFISIK